MREIRFWIPGIPSPGGSKHAFGIKKGGVYTGRAVVVEAAGEKTKFWRASVGQAAANAMGGKPLLEGAIELELLFHFLQPKSHFKKTGGLTKSANIDHITKPDAGKVARSTTDACKGIVWRDDCQIVKETHEKAYTGNQSGCWLTVRERKRNV